MLCKIVQKGHKSGRTCQIMMRNRIPAAHMRKSVHVRNIYIYIFIYYIYIFPVERSCHAVWIDGIKKLSKCLWVTMSKRMLRVGVLNCKTDTYPRLSLRFCVLLSFPKRFTPRSTRHSCGLLLPSPAATSFNQSTNGQDLERTKRLKVHNGKHAFITIDSKRRY